jgi:uncharacterized protein YceH (UPF0502 family)
VHFGQLTEVEQRVLGCLIEKRWTTPDQYPLSLNALRLACNQATNRDPVTRYDEGEVRDAAQRLSRYGLARLASGAGSRATTYRHLAEEGLGLDGELKSRTERMASIPSLADVERILVELAEKGYAERVPRRPGQKEDRFRQLLGGDAGGREDPIAAGGFDEPVVGHRYEELPRTYEEPSPSYDEAAPAPAPTPAGQVTAAPVGENGTLEARVAALEAEVADLRSRLADLLD